MPSLFDPVRLGALELRNRIVMAPLTRSRATDDRVPNDLMRIYYEQRASAGLILTEATIVTPKGAGYARTPGIYSDAQVEAWKPITEAVHRRGGKIVMQLWHVGRISDPSLIDGDLPVAPSAIQPAGHVSLLRPVRPYPTPRALDISEIPGIIEAYRKGAENAREAGFDGVELHGANGYLLDQFLQDKTNHRTDAYGGPIENRARLMLEAVDAAIGVWGASRVGLHLAPRGDSHDMGDSDPKATFGYVAREAGKRGLAFIFTREHLGDDRLTPHLKEQFGGALIANEGFTFDEASAEIAAGRADAVAWGKEFIANPDLVERFRAGAARNPLVPETIYSDSATGYTDYPALDPAVA
ncbi:N-ethylmaleimide reductase [uncultured Pleomorphomonas sp.]|uniref:N-ethylmaleimide reductase n=1 Tax=uncultured Pleomorphomonas sp. TaxID=442121 RepID=A0A212LNG6_9HYPH|nr:alkene reductase [uncultured Pleomorphomonas sp.]SCM78979.1 N-ethylmaleimide reductase [uncultured Pleomorphomonas sp.]